jgi:carbonic anhydrase
VTATAGLLPAPGRAILRWNTGVAGNSPGTRRPSPSCSAVPTREFLQKRSSTRAWADQGLGDLFVIRVAGNIVAPSQVGSIEFAADRFGARLVVVMGHSQCGAVQASLEEREQPSDNRSPNLGFIVNSILPGLEAVHAAPGESPEALLHKAVRANIRASADYLRHGSRILEQLIREHGLRVVGAEYSLETGVVDFFDGLIDR